MFELKPMMIDSYSTDPTEQELYPEVNVKNKQFP